ncbi:MAG: hypothetical protein ACOZB0_08390, partial [Pseudomonadota bacterium]
MADANAPESGSDLRRKAFIRLGVAALVTVVALLGLWWLDQPEAPKAKPRPPAPIVTAPATPAPTVPEPPEPEIPTEAAPEDAPA